MALSDTDIPIKIKIGQESKMAVTNSSPGMDFCATTAIPGESINPRKGRRNTDS